MKHNGNIYEYIGIYVDDIAAAAKDPKAITDLLQGKYQFKLKGTGPISFHLGCDFVREQDGTIACPQESTSKSSWALMSICLVLSQSRM